MDFNDIITHFGSVPEAVKGLNVSRATVYNWKKKGIPLDAQVAAEVRTKGQLRAALPSIVRKTAA